MTTARSPLRLPPHAFQGVVPNPNPVTGFVTSMAPQSWKGRPCGGLDRYWWPLLWTVPVAAQTYGVGPAPLGGPPTAREADYVGDHSSRVLSAPPVGRGQGLIDKPRAVLFRADGGTSLEGVLDALAPLAGQFLKQRIFCAFDPSVTAPVPLCCGLPPSDYVRVADPVPHTSGALQPFPVYSPSQWTGGDLLFLHLIDLGSTHYASTWSYFDPALGGSGDWTGGYVGLANARAQARVLQEQVRGVFDRLNYWVGYIDRADPVQLTQGGTNVLAGYNDFVRSAYAGLADLGGATFRDLGRDASPPDVAAAVREAVAQFYGITE